MKCDSTFLEKFNSVQISKDKLKSITGGNAPAIEKVELATEKIETVM